MFYRKRPHVFTLLLLCLSLFIGLLIGCQKPPVPEVHAVDPPAVKDRQRVTLHGVHLTYFNEIRIGDFVVDYDTYVIAEEHTNERLVFSLPPGLPPGTELLHLTHDRGETEGILIDLLGPGPLVQSIEPDSVRIGSQIRVKGQNLAGPATEALLESLSGELLITEFTEQTDTSLVFLIPETAPLNRVSLTVSVNTCPSNTVNFFILPPPADPPEITSLTPHPARVGDTLTITGHHFSPDNTRVIFPESIQLITFIEIDTNLIRLIVPPGVQPGLLQVVTDAASPGTFPDFALLPKIEALQPGAGKPGEQLMISGWNLRDLTAVRFSENPLPAGLFLPPLTDTLVKITIPELAPSPYELVLSTPVGDSNPETFIVIDSCDNQTPGILALANTPFQPGDTLTVSGTNFLEGTIIVTNRQGTNFPLINRINGQTLRVRIPDHLSCGTDSLIVNTICGTSEPFGFTIDKKPAIEPVTPATIKAGESIQLTGSFLTGATVIIDNVQISPDQQTATQINFKVPEDFPSGDYQLRVSTSCGTSDPISITVEEAELPPVISDIAPECQVPGESITIRGNNFPDSPQVLINDNTVDIISQGPNELEIAISADLIDGSTSADILIEVIDPATGLRSNAQTYRIFPRPIITSFLPGSNARGGPLFIRGDHLADVQTVYFNETAILQRSAGELVYLDDFQELAMNVPLSLSPGAAQICFDLSLNGCLIENICQEAAFTVTDGASEQLSPNSPFPLNLLIPNPPPGVSLPTVANNWMVLEYDGGDPDLQSGFLVISDNDGNCTEDGNLVFDIESDLGDVIGQFQKDGSYLELTYKGKRYEGKQHFEPDINYNNYDIFEPCKDAAFPFHIIFTPIEEGDQFQLIYPFILEDIEPDTVVLGKTTVIEPFIRGLGTDDFDKIFIDRAVLINQETGDEIFLKVDFNTFPERGIFIPDDPPLPVGTYDLLVTDGFAPSNSITLVVKEDGG